MPGHRKNMSAFAGKHIKNYPQKTGRAEKAALFPGVGMFLSSGRDGRFFRRQTLKVSVAEFQKGDAGDNQDDSQNTHHIDGVVKEKHAD